jgi:hypothetical protein
VRVGRVERLDRELREGDVDGCPEGRHRAEQRELIAARVAQAQRQDDLGAGDLLVRRFDLDTRVGRELVVEGLELGVARDRCLAAQPREQMRAPLGEVEDPGAMP